MSGQIAFFVCMLAGLVMMMMGVHMETNEYYRDWRALSGSLMLGGFGVMLIGVIGFFLVAAIGTAASHDAAHLSDWVRDAQLKDPLTENNCCGEEDCKVVPDGGIREVTGGYYIRESGETFPASRVIWRSRDGKWWRCAGLVWKDDRPTYPETRCLIGPPPST